MFNLRIKNKKKLKYISLILFVAALFSGLSAAAVKLNWISLDRVPISSALGQSESSETVSSGSQAEEIVYNKPAYMKAANLTPGTDFLVENTSDSNAIINQINTVFSKFNDLDINTIILNVSYNGKMIYISDIFPCYNDLKDSEGNQFDILNYIIKKAKDSGIFLYIKYDLNFISQDGLIVKAPSFTSSVIEQISANIKELVSKYDLGAIIFDNYYNEVDLTDYSAYRAEGAGVGFENWMRASTENLLSSASDTVNTYNKKVQRGIVLDPVWAYSSTKEGGISGSGAFQSYLNGYCDTKKLIDAGLFQFLIVKDYGSLTDPVIPFESVISWWSGNYQNSGIPIYIALANEKICTSAAGWSAPDQLARQLVTISKYKGYEGIILNSLSAFSENRQGSTGAVLKYFDGLLNSSTLFKDLTLTQPQKTKFTTYEDRVTFYGQSDPNFDISLNGQKIQINKNGDFAKEVLLVPGTNTVVFEHKGSKVTYSIFRKVQLIKDISPTGTVNANGGTSMSVTVTAYKGAKVTATINGTAISLQQVDTNDIDPNSLYTRFIGTYTLPAAKLIAQNLGSISVKATWAGTVETMTGAQININRLPDTTLLGQMIEVTANEGEIFPANTADDYNSVDEFFMPKGTIDYVVGDPVTYTTEGTAHTYYILKSGKRIYTTDVAVVNDRYYSNNAISNVSMNVSSNYTDIIVTGNWRVPFSCEAYPFVKSSTPNLADESIDSYNVTNLNLTFYYTNSVPGAPNLSSSPLFNGSSWSLKEEGGVAKAVLNIALDRVGRFYGLSSFYDSSGNLVLRFTNPLPMQTSGNEFGYSLSGAKIYIDAGHGGTGSYWDPGAINYTYQTTPVFEKDLNWSLSNKITNILRSLGADVRLVDYNTTYYSLDQRVSMAKSYNPNLFIAVHHNSVASPSTTSGPQSYYWSPYSKLLASSVYNQLVSSYSTFSGYSNKLANKKTGFGLYRVTRYLNFPSTLVEYGFINNNTELQYLLNDSVQTEFAKATVRGIIDYYK